MLHVLGDTEDNTQGTDHAPTAGVPNLQDIIPDDLMKLM